MARISAAEVRAITATMQRNRQRARDDDGRAGGLVTLPQSAYPIIVGDLHSCVANLKEILGHNDNLRRIRSGKGVLVLLGDLVHNDQSGELREMESSIATLEYVFELFQNYRNRIVHLRGNHDTFDDRLVKSGIRQGQEFYNCVVEKRGSDYADAVREYFDALPLCVLGDGYFIVHAGPVRGGTTRSELINIYGNEDHVWQVQWNRINEFGGTTSLKEYDESDIRATLRKLGLAADSQFIVGHNPLWNNGNRTGVWLNVLGINGHHILYSGAQTMAPYLTFEREGLTVNFAIAQTPEALYV